jgi:hypothetical protein
VIGAEVRRYQNPIGVPPQQTRVRHGASAANKYSVDGLSVVRVWNRLAALSTQPTIWLCCGRPPRRLDPVPLVLESTLGGVGGRLIVHVCIRRCVSLDPVWLVESAAQADWSGSNFTEQGGKTLQVDLNQPGSSEHELNAQHHRNSTC